MTTADPTVSQMSQLGQGACKMSSKLYTVVTNWNKLEFLSKKAAVSQSLVYVYLLLYNIMTEKDERARGDIKLKTPIRIADSLRHAAWRLRLLLMED